MESNQNWTEIHLEFNKPIIYGVMNTYKEIWINNGISYEQAKKLCQIGFEPKDTWHVLGWFEQDEIYRENIEKIGDLLKLGIEKNEYIFGKWLTKNKDKFKELSLKNKDKFDELSKYNQEKKYY